MESLKAAKRYQPSKRTLEDWCEDQRKMECCEGWQTKLRNVGS
jgi:hypothetical protein